MRLRSQIRRATIRGWRANLRLAEALVTVVLAAAVIHMRPFREALKFGSVPLGRGPQPSVETVDELSWSVRAVARRVPFRALCFEQGLALQRMLRRRGVDALLHYGIGKNEADLIEAHVWITAGDRIVIGEEGRNEFQSVAIFP